MITTKTWQGIASGLVLIAFCFGMLAGMAACSEPAASTVLDYDTQQAVKNVPPGATDIEPLSKGWVRYTYEGHRYLFLFYTYSTGVGTAVTRIDWDDTTKQ